MCRLLISEVSSEDDLTIVRALFKEYAAWLGVDLCFQGFEQELRSLPHPYGAPRGVIYLAKYDEEVAGCIALKPLSLTVCEMKRLYVKPAFRKQGIATALIERLIGEAERLGYHKMKLDTLGRMTSAISLYESFGFIRCEGYYHNPLDDVYYMEKTLQQQFST